MAVSIAGLSRPGGAFGEVARHPGVWLAGLGNAVAVYSLVIFGVVRIRSLGQLGCAPGDVLATGSWVLDLQMAGMLLGGIVWGILGDRRGRVAALAGSLGLHGVASLATAGVTDVTMYGWLRFLSGFGLAAEFGTAITLLAESLPSTARGHGTTLVAALGMLGAVAASIAGHHLPWRICYLVGGIAALILLVARARLTESGSFRSTASDVQRGNLLLLVRDRARIVRYLRCVAIGVPVWYVAGILMIFAPELGTDLGVPDLSAGTAILAHCIGAFAGNLLGGEVSHAVRSRRRAIAWFLAGMAVLVVILLAGIARSSMEFYALSLLIGIAAGYFGLFATLAAEQFGTNLRATVATTVPNLVRGAVVPLTLSFQYLAGMVGPAGAARMLAVLCLAGALVALRGINESYGRSLDFIEA